MKIAWIILLLISAVLMVISLIINQTESMRSGAGIKINTGAGSDNRKAVMEAAKIKTF